MSLNTALSGLQAASIELNVTSNNIANVSTTGFKGSRAEFADLLEISPFGGKTSTTGSGVRVSSVNQQFDQGDLEFTNASLDLAMSGQGFFIVDESITGGEVSYTRAGQFRVDADGYLTNSNRQYLQTFPVDEFGAVTTTSLNTTQPLLLPASTGAPEATTEIEIGLNLDSRATPIDPANFDPTDSATYSHLTSSTVYDSLGTTHIQTYYFVHDIAGSATNAANDLNQWAVFTYLDGVETDITGGTSVAHFEGGVATSQDAAIFNFNPDGSFNSTTPAVLQNTAVGVTNGANPLTIVHDFANNPTTQYSAGFAINTINPDGFSTGRLTGLEISEVGLIRAAFSNGTTIPIGQIALADFPNNQGLKNVGSSSWQETVDSGAVLTGAAATGRFGLIQSGALESSTVDLTSQLVKLITAQRNFQANARSIETSNSITDTIIQIR